MYTVNTVHSLLSAADWNTSGYDAFQSAAKRSLKLQNAG